MLKIDIRTSESYKVCLGADLLDKAGELISPFMKDGGKLMIVSDSTVFPLYGKKLRAVLEQTGAQVHEFVFPAGERSKNNVTAEAILIKLYEASFTRSDMLIALGGGVVGDLTGLVASVYMRGIRYVQIPTTVMAMVDSSVGGKTAIDTAFAKNLIGTFWQPSLVICDTATLSTLPAGIFNDGMAEVVKYAMIGSDELRELIMSRSPDIDKIIALSVYAKKEKVEADEHDAGIRKMLNFGHTAAHAIEVMSGYEISHGSAVAIGMMLITKEAARNGICSADTVGTLEKMLCRYSLPTECSFKLKDICRFTVNDKKRDGQTVTLIVPKRVGECYIKQVSIEDYTAYIEKL